MIKVISFDFDGTIVTHKFADDFWLEGVPKLYAKQNHIRLKDAQKYLLEEYEKIGDKRIEWYDPAYWFNRFKIKSDWNDLLKHYQQSVEIYPDAVPVLKRLSQHFPLIISSNAKREFIEIQLDFSDLKQYFTHIFSSTSDFHTVKKVTDFYDMICKKLSIQPQEMVHVGDHKEFDYLTPKKLGITAFYLNRNKTSAGPNLVHNLTQFEEIFIKQSPSNYVYHEKEL
ncbi:Phosphoglycolate phosphatase [uncultured archaeon]|nr:Phosphoglycolate phosphatase [uncultured archaeon]